jgi:HK97 gp10 family phage protein
MANGGLKMSAKMEGANGLRLLLLRLPKELQTKTLSNAVAKGARVIAAQAKAMVRVDTGLVRRSIRSTRGKRRDTEASAFVSVRSLSKKKVAAFKKETGKKSGLNPNDPYYWKVLEFGKSSRTSHPFIRPAFEAKKHEAAKEIMDYLREGIERIATSFRF